MPESKRPLKVFLCHASTDKPKVRELYRYLKKRGIQPWFDEEDLVGGQDWQVEIPKALATSDAIIICLTKNSVDKEGYIQKEIKFALDKALEMPEGRIFLIPVKFEECEVPFTLSRYQWVDLTVESGYAKMMKALKFRASQLERSTVEVSKKDIEENLAREKKEREIAEKDAREKAEKDVSEKARLKAEEEERQRIAKEKAEREAANKLAREKAEKESAEKVRLLAEEKEQKRIAKENADQEQKIKEARLKKEHETSEKARRSSASAEKVNQVKKDVKPEIPNPNSGTQVAYWVGGFALLVFGIILLSSLNTPSSTQQPTLENTQTQEVTISTQNTITPSMTLVAEITSTPANNKTLTPFGENSPFELVFVSIEGDSMNLYQLRTNGEKRNLTKDSQFSLIANPSLSSDGKVIAFETDKGMFGVRVDTALMMLISSFGNNPQWRPISNEIIFVSDDTGSSGNLCDMIWQGYARGIYSYDEVVNCINSRTEQEVVMSNQQIYLINLGSDEIAGGDSPLIDYRGIDLPNWNYTGTRLAYIKKENVDFICVDDVADTSKVIRVGCQQTKDFVESYDYSPVADEIVYSAEWKGISNIYLLNTEDFSQTDLTTGANNNYSPIWSHSGKQIVFVSDRDGNNEIYLMNIANSTFANLTLDSSNDFSPIWSPDDERIIFVSDRSGNLDIYSVDVNTLETVNLTNTPNDELFPIFIPSTKPSVTITSTPTITINRTSTIAPVEAILSVSPRQGKYPLTINLSANLKLANGSLVCNNSSDCNYSWRQSKNGNMKTLSSTSRSFSYTLDWVGTYYITVTVCHQGMCDSATESIEVGQ